MPGSDDQYDQVHTYSQDHAGKSKTTKPAVREIGRDGAPVQLYVGQDIDESSIRTPPANVRFLFFNTSGNLRKKNPGGTIENVGGGAPADASYITVNAESGLSNETVLGADPNTSHYSEVMGGTVANGDAGPVWTTTLADGEALEVTQAALYLDGVTAAPNGLDLIIADLTNNVSEATVIDGDGTLKLDQTGTPLASYQNTSGGEEDVGILLDNGNFNAGTGSDQDAIGSFIGRVA